MAWQVRALLLPAAAASPAERHPLLANTVPTSSEDFVAIYASPTEEVVGTTPPPQRVDEVHGLVAHKQRESLARGLLLMEVGHACGLLAQGNHRLLEALFYSPPVASALEASKPPPMFETEAWQELREQALGSGGLISRATLQHYIGLAQAQLRAQPLTPLHLCHALRLLSEAQHMTDSCGPPRVRLPADEAVLLLRLRDGNGIIEEEKVLQEATAKAADLANKAKQANLPPSTDKVRCNNALCFSGSFPIALMALAPPLYHRRCSTDGCALFVFHCCDENQSSPQ